MLKYSAISILVLLTSVVLSGCMPSAGVEPSAQPSKGSSAAPESPSPEPTPEPEATQPAVDELIVSPEGLSSLLIGEAPPVSDPALDIVIFDEDYCVTAVADGHVKEPGKWIPNYEPALSQESRDPFEVRVEDGVVTGIALGNELIRTESGLGIGSTVEQITAAYPSALRIEDGGNTDLYVITGEKGQLVFEVGVEGNNEYPVGLAHFVRVEPITPDPNGWANSGANYFACYAG